MIKLKIDLEKAKQEFIDYTNKYDVKSKSINRKIEHSIRVMNISKELSTKIGLKEEQVELATLIGLLHDIARFEQFTQFQTYVDLNSFDHGDYGVGILEKDIRKYIKTNKYDEIIKKAIKNHNKFEIEQGLTDEELLFAKIIRDADKIDIIYEALEMFWIGLENQINNTQISENVEKQFRNYKTIKREKNTTKEKNIDKVLVVIALVFDINFTESFKIIKNEDYINKIIDRFDFKDKETKEKMEEIRDISNKYIDEKIINKK